MTTRTRACGFYGTDAEIYYVAESGRAWIIGSADDLGTDDPVEIRAADIPAGATPVGGMLMPAEAIDYLHRIESAHDVKLIED